MQVVRPGSVFATLVVSTPAVKLLDLHGLDGEDTFNVAGSSAWTSGLVLDGGDPSASDTANFSGATGAVAINLADSTVANSFTVVTGFGGAITLQGVEIANLNTAGNTLTAIGYSGPNAFSYTPTGATAGSFTDVGVNTAFNFNTANQSTGTFTIQGQSDISDQVLVNGTNNSDFILVDSPNRNVWVENAAGIDLEPVHLDPSIELLTVNGKLGSDTFYVVPGLATATGPGGGIVGGAVPTNLLIDIEGGPAANATALVVGGFSLGGGANPVFNGAASNLAATDFTIINRSLDPNAGVVRTYRSIAGVPTLLPDVTYHNVGIVSPLVSGAGNLLVLGADNYEQNEFQATSAFLGSASTINAAHESIFPNVLAHRFAPADQDFFRVVAQTTGTLDFQVYFRLFSSTLASQRRQFESASG